jgi:hypothetical protein
MASKPDELLRNARDFMKKLALKEAEEASKQEHQHAEAEAEKKALLDRLKKPSGVFRRRGYSTGHQDHRARCGQRQDRGTSAPVSQPTVHG